MKKTIQIKEIVSRYINYEIEVEDEDDAEELEQALEQYVDSADHPDEITHAFSVLGAEITQITYGAEDVEYEMY